MNNRAFIITAVVGLLAGIGWLTYKNYVAAPLEVVDETNKAVTTPPVLSEPTPTSTPTPSVEPETISAPTPGTLPAVPAPTAVKEFTVSGANFSFTPAAMAVKKGDQVKITFKNVEGLHDWRLDEFNVATKRLNSGEEETVTFTADKAGNFEYYCSVGNHRALGMKGVLTVE